MRQSMHEMQAGIGWTQTGLQSAAIGEVQEGQEVTHVAAAYGVNVRSEFR